jgi:hypothetical protein
MNITAIYDTPMAGRKIRAVLESMLLDAPVVEEIALDLKLWRADLLTLPSVFGWSLEDARNSEILAVTFERAENMNEAVVCLTKRWCELPRDGAAVLVVVPLASSEKSIPPLLKTFRHIAFRNGIDFIRPEASSRTESEAPIHRHTIEVA